MPKASRNAIEASLIATPKACRRPMPRRERSHSVSTPRYQITALLVIAVATIGKPSRAKTDNAPGRSGWRTRPNWRSIQARDSP